MSELFGALLGLLTKLPGPQSNLCSLNARALDRVFIFHTYSKDERIWTKRVTPFDAIECRRSHGVAAGIIISMTQEPLTVRFGWLLLTMEEHEPDRNLLPYTT